MQRQALQLAHETGFIKRKIDIELLADDSFSKTFAEKSIYANTCQKHGG
jgi:hypothetical protein